MLGGVRRFVSAVSVAAIVFGGFASCAGWHMTAEARMACCADDACPMHAADAGVHSDVTQRDADQCCTASERPSSDQSRRESSVSISLTAIGAPLAILMHTPASLEVSWPRPLARNPSAAAVPKHLLLSVFLI